MNNLKTSKVYTAKCLSIWRQHPFHNSRAKGRAKKLMPRIGNHTILVESLLLINDMKLFCRCLSGASDNKYKFFASPFPKKMKTSFMCAFYCWIQYSI